MLSLMVTSKEFFVGWWTGKKFLQALRLKKKYWRYGYATEAAKTCVQYAFQDLKLASLVAHAHVDNSASHKVLQKIGFKYLKTFLYDGKNAFQYSIFNKDFAIRQISGKETWSVRHPVLRKGRPLEDCHFEGDSDMPGMLQVEVLKYIYVWFIKKFLWVRKW